jgi:hypothetical protein
LRISNPARPYIWRLIALSRLICPSIGPLLQGSVSLRDEDHHRDELSTI